MPVAEKEVEQSAPKGGKLLATAQAEQARIRELEAVRRELLSLAQEDKEIRKLADEIKKKSQANRDKHFILTQRLLQLINH